MFNLKLASINVNGMGEVPKRDLVNIDTLFVQETHCKEIPEWQGLSVLSFGSNRSSGCGFLFNKNLHLRILNCIIHEDGRFCAVDIELHNLKFRLATVYALNEPHRRMNFFENELSQVFNTDLSIIMAGNFNCVESQSLDTLNHSALIRCEVGSSFIVDLCANTGIVDDWRQNHPEECRYT